MGHLLQQRLDRSADRYPDNAVMRFQGQSLSYAELTQRSNQLAHLLADQGVGRHDRVGIFLDKSLETALALYGILKAGAAFVPIDPKSPAGRVASIVEDCGLKGIVSQPNKAKLLDEVAGDGSSLGFVVGLEAEISARAYGWETLDAFPADRAPDVTATEMDLAYIMYTSGSTGQPKGIMHTHHSGLSYVDLSAATYGVTHDDRLSNFPPLHFDQATFDYLTGPAYGATTTIIPEAFTLFPANLSQLMQDEWLTIWYSVPFVLIQLALRGVLEERDMSSLRWVLYGGEVFPLDHLRALMGYWPQARFSNVYGPAEVNQCTYYHLPPPDAWPEAWDSIPLGTVWDNTDVLILDGDDQVVTGNEVGELVVQSATMMQGYWNRPALNERAFYTETVDGGFERAYYRTGDLVYWGEDGLLRFVGRKDDQLKIRGYRVDLGEIDSVLVAHEGVVEASSYALHKADADEIGAAVLLHEGQTIDAGELNAYLKTRLAPYMIPSDIRFVADMPQTGTGKIDRRALQKQAHEALGLPLE